MKIDVDLVFRAIGPEKTAKLVRQQLEKDIDRKVHRVMAHLEMMGEIDAVVAESDRRRRAKHRSVA